MLDVGDTAPDFTLPMAGGDNTAGRFMRNVLDAFARPGPLPGGAWIGDEKLWR